MDEPKTTLYKTFKQRRGRQQEILNMIGPMNEKWKKLEERITSLWDEFYLLQRDIDKECLNDIKIVK